MQRLAALLGVAGLMVGCPPDEPAPLERVRPFTYLLKVHDTVGFKEAPQAFQVTPDGALNNGLGVVGLRVGQTLQPVSQRTRTLVNGHLPIIQMEVVEAGIRYGLEAFGLPADLDPTQNLMGYVRVTATNETEASTRARFALAWQPWADDGYTSVLTCVPWYCNAPWDSEAWSTESARVSVDGELVVRSGHALMRIPEGSATLETGEDSALVSWEHNLSPGEQATGTVLIPLMPIALARDGQLDQLRNADLYDTARDRAVAFWTDELSEGMTITLDERKVVDTAKASLAYLLIARDIEEDGQAVTHTVGENMYLKFFSRDASFYTRTYLMLGRTDLARSTLEHFVLRDSAGAAVAIKRLYPDDWGQSLWAMGSYLRQTGDVAFAEDLVAAVADHLDGFEDAIATDPLQLWPVAGPYDNENLDNGHYTGHSFWALLGLREAERIARAAGDDALALRVMDIHAGYRERFLAQLDVMTSQTGGFIPPGLDDPFVGFDWANASGGVYPFEVLEPDDLRVTATVDTLRPFKYREGLLAFGTNAWALRQGQPVVRFELHAYLTHYLTQTLLARGEQRAVVEDFYSILAHSSSTHGGFETSLRAWSNRDAGWNRGPHGWYASRYIELLRNMLVREEGSALHLLSAVSPQWAAEGKSIVLERAGTFFGTIERLAFDFTATGVTITITADWTKAPSELVVHRPFWASGPAVVAAASDAETVEVIWEWGTPPDLSHETAVRAIEDGFADATYPNMLFVAAP